MLAVEFWGTCAAVEGVKWSGNCFREQSRAQVGAPRKIHPEESISGKHIRIRKRNSPRKLIAVKRRQKITRRIVDRVKDV
jgi:hypothetical protein